MQYTHYSLCSKCKKNLCPDPPGICPSCQRRSSVPHPVKVSAPPLPETKNHTTRKALFAMGGVQWEYPSDGGALCFLRFRDVKVSIWRSCDRSFRYEISGKGVLEYRNKIGDYAFARLRALRHLARIYDMPLLDLCAEIRKKQLKSLGLLPDEI